MADCRRSEPPSGGHFPSNPRPPEDVDEALTAESMQVRRTAASTERLGRSLQCLGRIASGWQSAALCVIALSLALATWWTQSERLPPLGDEPHYVIMAVSVARDGDLELRNNYWWNSRTREVVGPINPHVVSTTRGWSPMHTPGLGVLLAGPWTLAGTLGARLALCVIALWLLAMGCWRRMHESLAPRAAWLAVLGLTTSVTTVFGSSQIYPDLQCGVIVLALATWVWSPSQRTSAGWAAYWLVAGLLPWLHTKYFVTSVLLAVVGAWRARRDQGRPALATAALFAAGSVSLMWWHLRTFGGVLGWRSLADLGTDPLRVLEIFLGLHLDQAQGMFFQQPLLLGGLVGLGHMVGRRHPLTVPWLLLYGSLIVPNSMELTRYGGGGPAGRFAWSAMWLWTIPLGVWLNDKRDAAERYVRPVVLTALAYQAALATRWIQTPSTLLPSYSELLWERNSLFPVDLRPFLPSFYYWDFRTYLAYPPNIVWVTLTVLLTVTGFMWHRRGSRVPARS